MCADPRIFVKGGGPDPTARKQPRQRFFLPISLFSSPQLILQFTEAAQRFNTETIIVFKVFRGGPTFSRGSSFFQGGGGANFYRKPI